MRIRRFGADVDIAAAKPRLILAMLGLYAGTLVQTDQMIDELWGDRPPASAARTVQTYVYHVRKLLRIGDNRSAADASRTVLLTRPGGYVLRLGHSSAVDVARFAALLDRGRDEVARCRRVEAVATLREALALWRGQPFADLRVGDVLSLARVRLEQLRRSALELRIDTEFELGRHRSLVDDLYELMLTDPTHEGYSARLMVALQACGRRTEALEVYHRLRRHLNDELGVVPSAAVQQVFQDALNDDNRAVAPAPSTVTVRHAVPRPALPQRPDLEGRDEELRRLRTALTRGATTTPQLTTVEVSGGPGIGTSSFVAHAAHDLASGFRDGAIFIDLAGVSGDGLDSLQSLCERFYGGGPAMPAATHLEDVASGIRDWSKSRQLLLIADHVSCARVLAALRPAGSGSAMIVVNRFGSPGQVGDELVELGPLGRDAMEAILAGSVGADRIQREPAAVRRLTELCEGNPLLLKGVARWLACRPTLSVARLIRQIDADPARLIRLWSAGRTIEDSVRARVAQLSSDASVALGAVADGALRAPHYPRGGAVLGDPAQAEVTCGALAASLRWRHPRLEAALDELSDAHLVEELGRVGVAPRGGGPVGDARVGDVRVGDVRGGGRPGESATGCEARAFRVRRIVGLSVAQARPAAVPPSQLHQMEGRPLDSRSIAV